MKRLWFIFAGLITIPSALVALIGQTAAWWWPGELCCHWTLHAALGLIVGAIVWRRSDVISRFCVLLMIVALVPWIRSAFDERAAPPDGSGLNIAWSNLYRYNEHRAEALAQISASDAELVGLTEVLPADRASLTRWPHQVWTPADTLNACALLSTKPIVGSKIRTWDGIEIIDAIVDMGDHPLRVLVCHLTAPLKPEWSQRRDQQIHELVATIEQTSVMATLVMGDLNLTPATHLWQPLLKATHLVRAPGFTPATWPAWSSPWARCPGIAIDHILVRNTRLAPLETWWVPGSDHLGLRTSLQMK